MSGPEDNPPDSLPPSWDDTRRNASRESFARGEICTDPELIGPPDAVAPAPPPEPTDDPLGELSGLLARVANGEIWDSQFVSASHRLLPAIDKMVGELREENERLKSDLKMWKPMTMEEAETAFAEAEAVPVSEEEIERIVKRATDPAERITNSEQAQLAARITALESQLALMREMLKGSYTPYDSFRKPWTDADIDTWISNAALARKEGPSHATDQAE